MRYGKFRTHLYKAALTVTEFARLMGLIPNSVISYREKEKVSKKLAAFAVRLARMTGKKINFGSAIADPSFVSPFTPMSWGKRPFSCLETQGELGLNSSAIPQGKKGQ